VITERTAFRAGQAGLTVKNLVWIDEAGMNLSMTTMYARARRGQRAVEHRPSTRTAKTSLVGAITSEGMVSLGTVQGSYNTARFLAWLATDLLPKLGPGRVLVWDNIRFHFNVAVVAAVKAAGCTLLKMPPYSPDLNPIEECWSKLKQSVRRLKARTQAALDSAIEAARAQLQPADFTGWIRHAGYPTPGST